MENQILRHWSCKKDPGNDDWEGDSEDDNDENGQEPYKYHDFYRCYILLSHSVYVELRSGWKII